MQNDQGRKGFFVKTNALFLISLLLLGAVFMGGCNTTFTPSAASNPANNTALPVPQETALTTNIAFTGCATSSDNSFTFVVLQTLSAGSTLYFTDKGWDDTANPPGFTSSKVMTFVPTNDLPPGSQVIYTEPASGTSVPASLVKEGTTTTVCGTFNSTFGMSKDDWECIAYQISGGVTQFLTAINENSSSPWLSGNRGTPAKGFSYLPPGLNYQNSIDLFTKEAENIVFTDCQDVQYPNEITTTALLALLVYTANWTAGPTGSGTVLPGIGVTECDFTAVILPTATIVSQFFNWGPDLGFVKKT